MFVHKQNTWAKRIGRLVLRAPLDGAGAREWSFELIALDVDWVSKRVTTALRGAMVSPDAAARWIRIPTENCRCDDLNGDASANALSA